MSEYIQLYYVDAEIVRDLVDEALDFAIYHGNPKVYSRERVFRIKDLANILGEMDAQIKIAKREDQSWEKIEIAKGEDQ
jgi:hypothetical protein